MNEIRTLCVFCGGNAGAKPIYSETAAYGHMGRTPHKKTVQVKQNGNWVEKEVETFTWEKLDYVDKIKAAFGL